MGKSLISKCLKILVCYVISDWVASAWLFPDSPSFYISDSKRNCKDRDIVGDDCVHIQVQKPCLTHLYIPHFPGRYQDTHIGPALTPLPPPPPPHRHIHVQHWNTRPQVLTRTHKQKAVAEKLTQEITKKMENRSHEEKFQKNSRQEKQFRLIELKNGNIQSMMPRECGPGFSYLLSIELITLTSNYDHQLHFTWGDWGSDRWCNSPIQEVTVLRLALNRKGQIRIHVHNKVSLQMSRPGS